MKARTLVQLLALSSTCAANALAQAPPQASPSPFSRPRTVAAASTPAPQQQATTPAQAPTASPLQVPSPTPARDVAPADGTAQPGAAAAPLVSAPFIVQAARPVSPGKVRAGITEAQRALKARVRPTALGQPSLNFVTLAALDADSSQVHLLTLPKETFLKRNSELTLISSQGTPLRLRVVRPNYVNTAVVVADLTGRQLLPLAVEYPIEKFGRFRELAYYTSAHPALLSPELVKQGQAYVRTMLELAAKRLKEKNVQLAPAILDMAERLCLVEHVDHQRFRTENRRALYEEVYALYALNELDTYKYSVSFAGAGGMVQMIPSTYQMLRRLYPSVGLNPDFVLGMRNHGNALEAMLLYMQFTWNDLTANADVSEALAARIAKPHELMAAGYNSNPARLGSYIRRGGAGWRTLIPRETQMYLQILSSVESLMQFKTRVKEAAEQPKPEAPQAGVTVENTPQP